MELIVHEVELGLTEKQLDVLCHVEAVLLDMDGVVYVGNQALPGVQDLLDYLDLTGRRWLCVTNNSSRDSVTFAEKLAGMDIRVDPAHILGSAQATAAWLAHQAPPGTKVLMMGEQSLHNALAGQGFDLIEDPFAAEVVVASINFSLNYEKLTNLTLAIRNGARFVATNPDPSLPTERGQVPGTGSIVALLSTASGRQPEFVGKPYPGMYQQAMEQLGSSTDRTLMIGDRYETDIVGAVQLGMPTLGVLTGVSTREEFETADPPAMMVLPGLPELLAALQLADERG
jgi:4-nitrophenyl phosphatase